MKRVGCIVMLLILLGAMSVYAQPSFPEISSERVTLSSPNGVISMAVPHGWQFSSSQQAGLPPFGSMSNLAVLAPGAAPSKVQMIFRNLSELNVPVDTTLSNPGLDYLQKYARERGLAREGAYSEPVELRDGFFRAGLMLYVERQSVETFDTAVLSLALATYLGEDELAILLFEGPAHEWAVLLSLWNLMLETLERNGQPLDFPDLPQVLIGFEAPDSLVARYESGDTLPENIQEIEFLPPGDPLILQNPDVTVEVYNPQTWEIALEPTPTSAQVVAPEQLASIGMAVIEQGNEYQSPGNTIQALLEADPAAEAMGEILVFDWDRYPAAAGLFVMPGTDEIPTHNGTFVIMELDDSLLILRFEVTQGADIQLVRDWLNFVSAVKVNGIRLGFNEVWGVLFQLAEEPPQP